MKLQQNPFDTSLAILALSQKLEAEFKADKGFDLEHVKSLHDGLVAEHDRLSRTVSGLGLDTEDEAIVSARLKNVFDQYLNPLKIVVISQPRLFTANRNHAAHCVSHADTVLKALTFTLECSEAVA